MRVCCVVFVFCVFVVSCLCVVHSNVCVCVVGVDVIPQARDFLDIEADTDTRATQTFAFANNEPGQVHADLRSVDVVDPQTDAETQTLLRSVLGDKTLDTRFAKYRTNTQTNTETDSENDSELDFGSQLRFRNKNTRANTRKNKGQYELPVEEIAVTVSICCLCVCALLS